MGKAQLPALIAALFFVFSLGSCRTAPPSPPAQPGAAQLPALQPPGNGAGGIVEEIRFYTEKGTPSSILNALHIIESRNLGSTEFGRMMITINVTLLMTLYPAIEATLPRRDPPLLHRYARILRDAANGIFTIPDQNSEDFFEHVLPFLSLYPGPGAGGRNVTAEQYRSALPFLEKAAGLNPESVLPPYFIGIVYEKTGLLEEAFLQFSSIWEQFPECFPAAIALARVLDAKGRNREAIGLLSDLMIRFPGNIQVKRQLARALYQNRDWSRAETLAAEILQRNSRDAEFLLMQAHIYVEQGRFLQALVPLNTFISANPGNSLHYYLRARIHLDGFNNRNAALNYTRSILRFFPASDRTAADDRIFLFAIRLLMDSQCPQDRAEGRNLINRMLDVPAPSLELLSLALEDVIYREEWEEARRHIDLLLLERRSYQDLLSAYIVERGLGNNAAAFSFARELFERDRLNDEGILIYVSALIEIGRRGEAARLIESRLNTVIPGPHRSQYLYLRSRLRGSEELAINDLQASLFEDPRNLTAIIALFEIHHRRGDERRAVHFLRQGLALAPENPRLLNYAQEYNLR